MFKNPDQIVGHGHRCGVVSGAKSTGKTTFVVSGSQFAPDVLPAKEMVDCSDVVLLQFEAESALGALDMNLRPRVIDFVGMTSWPDIAKRLSETIKFLRPLCESGEVQIVGVDLGVVDKIIRAACAGVRNFKLGEAPDVNISLAAKDIDWNRVAAQGMVLYQMFQHLPCMVLGMCHLKVTENNPYDGMADARQKQQAELARDVQGMGGDRAKLSADLAKGIAAAWVAPGSLYFARELETKNTGTAIAPKMVSRYVTHTQSDSMFEAGSRRASKLAPIETRTLRAILKDMYTF